MRAHTAGIHSTEVAGPDGDIETSHEWSKSNSDGQRGDSHTMVKDLIVKGIKRPKKIPAYLRGKIRYIFNVHVRKRLPFNYEAVVRGWGIKGAELPHFSARLYREVKLLNDAIGNYHAKRSLEIGCGYGRLTPWIAEHSEQHYAIEPESVLLESARKLYPDICFYQTKAQKLSFSNCYFDLCVSWTVLQHILPKELNKAATEIKRVCAPEAIIILAEGVGKKRDSRYWEHTLEEWKHLFLPWKLTWCSERKIEETFKGNAGLVMRFKRIN